MTEKTVFTKEVRALMYGYGDSDPQPESVELREELVQLYIEKLVKNGTWSICDSIVYNAHSIVYNDANPIANLIASVSPCLYQMTV